MTWWARFLDWFKPEWFKPASMRYASQVVPIEPFRASHLRSALKMGDRVIRRFSSAFVLLCLVPSVRGQVTVTVPAGTTITTTGPTQITYGANSITLAWGVSPPMPPTPPPVPQPDPVPVLTGEVWALVVYSTDVVPVVATGPAVVAAATANQVQVVQAKSTDPSVSSWLPELKSTGTPALLFIQKTAVGLGACPYKIALPQLEADFVAILKKVRGK